MRYNRLAGKGPSGNSGRPRARGKWRPSTLVSQLKRKTSYANFREYVLILIEKEFIHYIQYISMYLYKIISIFSKFNSLELYLFPIFIIRYIIYNNSPTDLDDTIGKYIELFYFSWFVVCLSSSENSKIAGTS